MPDSYYLPFNASGAHIPSRQGSVGAFQINLQKSNLNMLYLNSFSSSVLNFYLQWNIITLAYTSYERCYKKNSIMCLHKTWVISSSLHSIQMWIINTWWYQNYSNLSAVSWNAPFSKFYVQVHLTLIVSFFGSCGNHSCHARDLKKLDFFLATPCL